jgi:hypothetical protein
MEVARIENIIYRIADNQPQYMDKLAGWKPASKLFTL